MSHRLTDIIVTDQSHRYIYITSETAEFDLRNHPEPLTPTPQSEKFGLWMKMEPKVLDRPLGGRSCPGHGFQPRQQFTPPTAENDGFH